MNTSHMNTIRLYANEATDIDKISNNMISVTKKMMAGYDIISSYTHLMNMFELCRAHQWLSSDAYFLLERSLPKTKRIIDTELFPSMNAVYFCIEDNFLMHFASEIKSLIEAIEKLKTEDSLDEVKKQVSKIKSPIPDIQNKIQHAINKSHFLRDRVETEQRLFIELDIEVEQQRQEGLFMTEEFDISLVHTLSRIIAAAHKKIVKAQTTLSYSTSSAILAYNLIQTIERNRTITKNCSIDMSRIMLRVPIQLFNKLNELVAHAIEYHSILSDALMGMRDAWQSLTFIFESLKNSAHKLIESEKKSACIRNLKKMQVSMAHLYAIIKEFKHDKLIRFPKNLLMSGLYAEPSEASISYDYRYVHNDWIWLYIDQTRYVDEQNNYFF